MKTSLIQMLELSNFGHMTHLQYNLSHVMIFWGHAMDRNDDVINFISKYHYCRKA